jgi:lipopolysaccharide/colanic/teichoic acid biosynthesis glycosyltransferase
MTENAVADTERSPSVSRNSPVAKRPSRSRSTGFVPADAPAKHDLRRSFESRFPVMDRKPAARRRYRITADREQPAQDGPWHIAPAGNRSRGYLIAKRVFDVAGAVVVLVFVLPVLLATFLVLMVTTRGHPIFSQYRLGFLGRPFRLYKFRTMVPDAEKLRSLVKNEQEGPVFKNRADPRITSVGRFLRKTSIDELPQLFNVLRGDMSLIGPRPPLQHEVLQYTPLQRKRLSVRPGLSCLWQVSGRNEIGFTQWMQMDLWYVKHQNMLTDLAILLRTPWAVISRRGAQ